MKRHTQCPASQSTFGYIVGDIAVKEYYSYNEVLQHFDEREIVHLLRHKKLRIVLFYKGDIAIEIYDYDGEDYDMSDSGIFYFTGYIEYDYLESIQDCKIKNIFSFVDIYDRLNGKIKTPKENEYIQFKPTNESYQNPDLPLESFLFIADDVDKLLNADKPTHERTDIEQLKKENAELKAQLEQLRNKNCTPLNTQVNIAFPYTTHEIDAMLNAANYFWANYQDNQKEPTQKEIGFFIADKLKLEIKNNDVPRAAATYATAIRPLEFRK